MTPTVERVGRMHFEGNLIPHNWYHTDLLKLTNGKPNLVAITLLADIMYWYRPTVIRDEVTGHIIEVRQKFASDRLQKNYRKWGQQFGFSQRQVEDAMAFLRHKGLVDVQRRAVPTEYGVLPNCAFIEPVLDMVEPMSSPVITGEPSSRKGPVRHGETGKAARSSASGAAPKRETITKTSPKTNKEEQRAAAPRDDSPAALEEKCRISRSGAAKIKAALEAAVKGKGAGG